MRSCWDPFCSPPRADLTTPEMPNLHLDLLMQRSCTSPTALPVMAPTCAGQSSDPRTCRSCSNPATSPTSRYDQPSATAPAHITGISGRCRRSQDSTTHRFTQSSHSGVPRSCWCDAHPRRPEDFLHGAACHPEAERRLGLLRQPRGSSRRFRSRTAAKSQRCGRASSSRRGSASTNSITWNGY